MWNGSVNKRKKGESWFNHQMRMATNELRRSLKREVKSMIKGERWGNQSNEQWGDGNRSDGNLWLFLGRQFEVVVPWRRSWMLWILQYPWTSATRWWLEWCSRLGSSRPIRPSRVGFDLSTTLKSLFSWLHKLLPKISPSSFADLRVNQVNIERWLPALRTPSSSFTILAASKLAVIINLKTQDHLIYQKHCQWGQSPVYSLLILVHDRYHQ